MRTAKEWVNEFFNTTTVIVGETKFTDRLEALILNVQIDAIDAAKALALIAIDNSLNHESPIPPAPRNIQELLEDDPPDSPEDDNNSPKTTEELEIDRGDLQRDIDKGDLK